MSGGVDTPIRRFDGKPVSAEHIEREAKRMMAEASVQGLGMAVIDDAKVVFVRSWGRRNVAKDLALQTDTIMYGASLTKFAFAYMVMQLVDEGTVDLDRSIATYLSKPLPVYPSYEALQGIHNGIKTVTVNGSTAIAIRCRMSISEGWWTTPSDWKQPVA